MSQPSTLGVADDRDALFAQVYEELRALAQRQIARERPGHTLQPTALVNELYLRLFGGPAGAPLPTANRRLFFAAAAEAMRRILIESARRKGRVRHGGKLDRVDLDPDQFAAAEVADDVLALDEALTAFTAVDPAAAELVQLRFFGGLSLKDAAATLDVPIRTANRQWAYARAWLQAEMSPDDEKSAGVV